MAKLKWSNSKHDALEKCAKYYYFHYFGSNKSLADAELLHTQLRYLKSIKNRYLRTGEILHHVIRSYFKNGQAGDVWSQERLESFALYILEKDINHSRKYPDGRVTNEQYPPSLLLEYHHREPNADEIYSQMLQRLSLTLHNFTRHPAFDEIRVNGLAATALIEKRFSLNLGPIDVIGVVDLVYQKDDEVVLADWKSGAASGTGDGSLQLAIYALWAKEHYKIKLEQIRVFLCYLGSGDLVTTKLTEEKLSAARLRVLQDIDRLKLFQLYGKQGEASAFTPCLIDKICSLCQYQGVCYA